MYQALYRKYRPQRFCDVVGQKHVTDTLRRQVETGRTAHAYLFIGSRGTGKTSCAKILSRALNCLDPRDGEPCNECAACRSILSGASLDVAEIDAASNNGVENVRQLREEAIYSPASLKKRVYIIDEVHMLSNSAFNALLKIMEEPPEHLVFILATTELNKVPATILSRCQRFSFKRLTAGDIEGRVREVVEREGGEITDAAARLIARLSDGAMRDALSLLDQCMTGGPVTEDGVVATVGLAGAKATSDIWRCLTGGDAAGAISFFEKVYSGGTDPTSVLNELLTLARNVLMARVAPNSAESLLSGSLGVAELNDLGGGISTGAILRAGEALQSSISSLASLRDKRTAAELCLVKLAGVLTGQAEEAPAPAVRPTRPVRQPAAPQPQQPRQPEPEEERPPVPEAPPEEQSTTGEPARPLQEPGFNWWAAVLSDKGVQGCTAYRFLTGSDFTARESGPNVTLMSRNPFIINMLDKNDVKAAVGAAASRALGRPVTVVVKKDESAPEPKLDKLRELGDKFANFNIK